MLKVQSVMGSILGAAVLHAGGIAYANDADAPITTANDVGMGQVSASPAGTAGDGPVSSTRPPHDYAPQMTVTQTVSFQQYKTPIGDFKSTRSETKVSGQMKLPAGVLMEAEGFFTTHDNFTVNYDANNGGKTANSEFVIRAQPHYILSIPALKGQELERKMRLEVGYFTLQKEIAGTMATVGVLKPEMRMGVTSAVPVKIMDYLPDQALLTPRMAALHLSRPIVKTEKFNADLNVMAGTVLQRIVGPYDLGVLGGNVLVHSIRDADPKNRSFSQPAETTDTGHAFGASLNSSWALTSSLTISGAASVVQPNGATNYKPPHLRGAGTVAATYKRQFDTVAVTFTGAAAAGSYRRDYFGMVTSPSTTTYAFSAMLEKNGYKMSAEIGRTRISNTGDVHSNGDVTAYEVKLSKEFGRNISAGVFFMGRNTDLYPARVTVPRAYYPVSRQPDVVVGGFDINVKFQ